MRNRLTALTVLTVFVALAFVGSTAQAQQTNYLQTLNAIFDEQSWTFNGSSLDYNNLVWTDVDFAQPTQLILDGLYLQIKAVLDSMGEEQSVRLLVSNLAVYHANMRAALDASPDPEELVDMTVAEVLLLPLGQRNNPAFIEATFLSIAATQ